MLPAVRAYATKHLYLELKGRKKITVLEQVFRIPNYTHPRPMISIRSWSPSSFNDGVFFSTILDDVKIEKEGEIVAPVVVTVDNLPVRLRNVVSTAKTSQTSEDFQASIGRYTGHTRRVSPQEPFDSTGYMPVSLEDLYRAARLSSSGVIDGSRFLFRFTNPYDSDLRNLHGAVFNKNNGCYGEEDTFKEKINKQL